MGAARRQFSWTGPACSGAQRSVTAPTTAIRVCRARSAARRVAGPRYDSAGPVTGSSRRGSGTPAGTGRRPVSGSAARYPAGSAGRPEPGSTGPRPGPEPPPAGIGPEPSREACGPSLQLPVSIARGGGSFRGRRRTARRPRPRRPRRRPPPAPTTAARALPPPARSAGRRPRRLGGRGPLHGQRPRLAEPGGGPRTGPVGGDGPGPRGPHVGGGRRGRGCGAAGAAADFP